MQSLVTLTLAPLILAGTGQADEARIKQEKVQKRIEERNAVINSDLQRKLEALLDERFLKNDLLRAAGSTPELPNRPDTLLLAVR